MDTSYIKTRVKELFTYLEYLKEAADKDTVEANKIVSEIKSTEEEEEKINLITKFKKIQFFNNMKLMEVEKTIPILIEMYKLSQSISLDLELNEVQQDMIEINLKRNQPMYIVDKNELVFLNKELEEVIDQELSRPADTDAAAIKNVLGALSNGN